MRAPDCGSSPDSTRPKTPLCVLTFVSSQVRGARRSAKKLENP